MHFTGFKTSFSPFDNGKPYTIIFANHPNNNTESSLIIVQQPIMDGYCRSNSAAITWRNFCFSAK
jgi:hypothetical protein